MYGYMNVQMLKYRARSCLPIGRGVKEHARFPRHISLVNASRSRDGMAVEDECLLRRLIAPVLVSCVVSMAAPCYSYENVRVEDVDSDLLQSGLQAANSRNWEAAERFFKAYLNQEDPTSASGYSNLGNVHLQMGKTLLAVEDYDKAVRYAPGAAVPIMNRGLAYEQLGVQKEVSGDEDGARELWKKGKADLLKAIELDKDEFAAYYDLGLIELRLNEYEDSAMHLERAADLAPGIAGYRVRSAVLKFQIGDEQKAAQQLRGVVRKYGNYAEAHAALGSVYWSQGKLGEAEEELAKAVEIDEVWGDASKIRQNTRWPPKLYDAYFKLIRIS